MFESMDISRSKTLDEDTVDLAKQFGIKVAQKMTPTDPVIVVEDQQDLRLIVSHHLNKRQFKKVIQAGSGLEALELLRIHKKVTCVICSMDMPGMGGLDLLAEVREDTNIVRPPFALSIGNVSKEKLMFAIESGVDDVMVKPYTLSDIVPKIESAFKVFNNPKNPEQAYELAKKYLREGAPKEAQKIFFALSEAAPRAARPLVGLAKVSMLDKNNELALGYLDEAEKNNPNYVHTFSFRGKLYEQMGENGKAIESYKAAIDLSPLNPVRYQEAVDLLLKQKRFQDVTDLLSGAVEKGLGFPSLYHYLSEAFFNLKDYKKAVRYIRSALSEDPDNINYNNQLGIALKESELYEESLKTYNKVLKLDPGNRQATFNKCILLEHTGKMSDAIRILEKAVAKDPEFTEAATKLSKLKSSSKAS